MPWGVAAAAVGAAGSIGGALMSSNASQSAANTQANAANNATNAQLQMFNTTQQNLLPYMNQGDGALNVLGELLGTYTNPGFVGPGGLGAGSLVTPFTSTTFQNSPGYNFALQQGVNAIDNSSAAKGLTGNTLASLMSYGIGLENQDYYNAANLYNTDQSNIFNRLFSMVNTGQNAATNTGQMASQVGSQIGSNMIGAGNAMAAGQVGSANAIANGLSSGANSIGNDYMLYQLMNNGGFSGGGSSPYAMVT